MPATRSVLLTCDAAPAAGSRLREALEAAMAYGAFEQPVSLLLLGDAVGLLQPGQQAQEGARALVRLAGALPDYGIERIHAEAGALQERAIDEDRLALPATPVDAAGIRALIAAHDVVLAL